MTEIKRAPCVHGDPCRESQCPDYGRTTTGPDIDSLIAAARHNPCHEAGVVAADGHAAACVIDDEPWPCPDRTLIDALVSERETLQRAVRNVMSYPGPVHLSPDTHIECTVDECYVAALRAALERNPR